MVITAERKMHRSSYINWRMNNYQKQIAGSVSTMKTRTLSVIVSCVCVLLVLDKLVYNVSASGGRILNGDAANPADYKFLIHILYQDINIIWQCGGSVISNHFILTAAHCLYKKRCIKNQLHPSTWSRGDPPPYFAAQCHIHEDYDDESLANDIALVQTRENLLANQQIRKIALPAQGTVYSAGTLAQIAGWGKMENGVFPDTLMHAIVRVIDWNQCQLIFKATEDCENGVYCPALADHGFCTTGDSPNPPGPCVGDSGGPVIIAGKVAGLVSSIILTGADQCDIGSPAAHVKVADYIPWIGNFVDL